jgi:DNA polymerase-4
MRASPTVLHLDLDAFYASVEQRDKPSLRGKPVVVGGVGGRGVVATASYEARRFGVRSAMSTAEARSRCPHAAFLSPRSEVYRASSEVVMRRLREISPLVEPLSLDEAFVDLAPVVGLPAEHPVRTAAEVERLATELRADIQRITDGLTASVGVATSKLMAKIASELAKPDGLMLVAAGAEHDLLRPMQVTVVPGVGPATAQRLRRIGVHTIADLEQIGLSELVSLIGSAHGTSLHRLARGIDDRPVLPDRETKSVSVEDTFELDLTDPALLTAIVDRMAQRVAERLRAASLSGRTVTLKVRHHDFSTLTRSQTLAGPTDDRRVIARSPAACCRRSTPRTAYDCSESGCTASRTGSRTTCSPTRRSPRPPRCSSCHRRTRCPRRCRGGGRGWTSSTPSTGGAGSGEQASAGSRCGSRRGTPPPARC